MNKLLQVWSRLRSRLRNDAVEAYLAQSTDLNDVERRLREVDRFGLKTMPWN